MEDPLFGLGIILIASLVFFLGFILGWHCREQQKGDK